MKHTFAYKSCHRVIGGRSLDAIRKLSEADRRTLIEELISEDFAESPKDIAAIQEGLDQAERGQLIDLEEYGIPHVAGRIIEEVADRLTKQPGIYREVKIER